MKFKVHPWRLAGLICLGVFLLGAVGDGWVWWQGERRILPAPRGNAPAWLVVPGASVYRDGRLSPVLKERMDAALLAHLAWPDSRFLFSGTSISDGYNEVWAMRRYAISRGADSSLIHLDGRGDNTERTVAAVRRLLRPGERAVIVSQAWHLPRALWLGESIDLHGLSCNSDTARVPAALQVREHCARARNFLLAFVP